MTRSRRFVSFAVLIAIGVTAGALLKRGVAQSESFKTNERLSRSDSGAVVRQFAASPTLPDEGVLPVGGAVHVHMPRYHPRDSLEWQGMLVDLSMQAICESSKQCGLAMACHSGQCGPCTRDDECATGEGCVLDHCVIRPAIACRLRRDCAAGELCVLSGYSSDARGNADLTARCLAAVGGTAQEVDKLAPRSDVPAAPTPVRADDLMRELAEEVRP